MIGRLNLVNSGASLLQTLQAFFAVHSFILFPLNSQFTPNRNGRLFWNVILRNTIVSQFISKLLYKFRYYCYKSHEGIRFKACRTEVAACLRRGPDNAEDDALRAFPKGKQQDNKKALLTGGILSPTDLPVWCPNCVINEFPFCPVVYVTLSFTQFYEHP